MGRPVGSGRLGLGTHPWLRVAEWRDRADVSVFFFRFHSGGVGRKLRRFGQGRPEGAAPAGLPLDGFFAVPVSFLWKRKKMTDARDVVRVPHCAAALAFWIDCSPIDSPPIIAFPRETSSGPIQDQKPKPMPIPIPKSCAGCRDLAASCCNGAIACSGLCALWCETS